MKTTLALSFLLAAIASAAPKKNVLLIAIDDLKPTLGAYGDPIAKTPNIDKLASRGLLFERAYTNQALCSPSRNALLAGLTPSTLGIYDLNTNFRKAAPDAVTLPQYFVKNGWRAEAVGKLYHIGHGNHDDTASWSVPHLRPAAPTYALPENQASKEPGAPKNGTATEAADVSDDTYADGKTADEIVRRLEAAKGRADTPFFIAAGFIRPHLPFVSPKKYWDLYQRSDFKLPGYRKAPVDSPAPAFRRNSELGGYKDTTDSDHLTDTKQLELLHGYYAAASYTDAQIGRVLDALDRLGLTENTIVVLWGDHGWHLGDHGLWAKMTDFEQATRIPFIVSAPGVTPAGKKTSALVQSADVYPTLVELAGLPAPQTTPKLDGSSLVPVLKDPAASIHEDVLQVVPRGEVIGRALRNATHRFVEWKKPGAPTDTAEIELYDYTKDPEEKQNLAASQPEIVAKFRERLATYGEAKPQLRGAAAETPAAGKNNRAALFQTKDKNADGQLSSEEFLAGQANADAAKQRLVRFDKNNDGILSKPEFIAAGN